MVWLFGCLLCNVITSNIATRLEPRDQKAHQKGYGHSPINGKKQNFGEILQKVWYTLDTNDHDCGLYICVSKCGLRIREAMWSEMVYSHFK